MMSSGRALRRSFADIAPPHSFSIWATRSSKSVFHSLTCNGAFAVSDSTLPKAATTLAACSSHGPPKAPSLTCDPAFVTSDVALPKAVTLPVAWAAWGTSMASSSRMTRFSPISFAKASRPPISQSLSINSTPLFRGCFKSRILASSSQSSESLCKRLVRDIVPPFSFRICTAGAANISNTHAGTSPSSSSEGKLFEARTFSSMKVTSRASARASIDTSKAPSRRTICFFPFFWT
mmetsp:Transcript_49238/g.120052  ORF Transcript_49238/g.120052 Transcript_49238/m.120052 type:complete len:235 (-) Transcript_49238:471-1175(-)